MYEMDLMRQISPCNYWTRAVRWHVGTRQRRQMGKTDVWKYLQSVSAPHVVEKLLAWRDFYTVKMSSAEKMLLCINRGQQLGRYWRLWKSILIRNKWRWRHLTGCPLNINISSRQWTPWEMTAPNLPQTLSKFGCYKKKNDVICARVMHQIQICCLPIALTDHLLEHFLAIIISEWATLTIEDVTKIHLHDRYCNV